MLPVTDVGDKHCQSLKSPLCTLFHPKWAWADRKWATRVQTARWVGDGWFCSLSDKRFQIDSNEVRFYFLVVDAFQMLSFWRWDHFCPSYVWVVRGDSSHVRLANGGDLCLFLPFVFGAKSRLLSESLPFVPQDDWGHWMLYVVNLDLRQNKRENLIICLWCLLIDSCFLVWIIFAFLSEDTKVII